MNQRRPDNSAVATLPTDIYAVGLLADLLAFVNAPRAARGRAWKRVVDGLRRDWRRRSHWNGFLAEPLIDDGTWTRAGHGWTRGRAWDDLQDHRLAYTKMITARGGDR